MGSKFLSTSSTPLPPTEGKPKDSGSVLRLLSSVLKPSRGPPSLRRQQPWVIQPCICQRIPGGLQKQGPVVCSPQRLDMRMRTSHFVDLPSHSISPFSTCLCVSYFPSLLPTTGSWADGRLSPVNGITFPKSVLSSSHTGSSRCLLSTEVLEIRKLRDGHGADSGPRTILGTG